MVDTDDSGMEEVEEEMEADCETEDDRESELSDDSDISQEKHRKISPNVLEDMVKFEESFKGITQRFRLINRIGEGTFSTVYKAEDLLYDDYVNDWDLDASDDIWVSPQVKKNRSTGPRRKAKFVAIKKIYVTSSPSRIHNELELLHDLRHCKAVCPLITAFRCQDQVVAVLPYYRHQDFREYFRDMRPIDMQFYFRELFKALAAVHEVGILHRDIKPTNFLYDYNKRRGVLVDFGLAEREGTDSTHCICQDASSTRIHKIKNSYVSLHGASTAHPKDDTRPPRRANRAGTRGFRAPEVLFKCAAQGPAIDVWAAGVVLLTVLARRFPFFHSTDDVDAMLELASVFGNRRLKAAGLLHGAVFKCSIPTVGENGYPLQKLVDWSTSREATLEEERPAVEFLARCLELDPRKRISAREALGHDFLVERSLEEEVGEDEMDMI